MNEKNKTISNVLAQAFDQFRKKEEISRFLRDLLTKKELIELTKRWQTAQMLAKKIPYTKISENTRLSSATIAQISKWYKKGLGGYKLAIMRWGKYQKFGEQ